MSYQQMHIIPQHHGSTNNDGATAQHEEEVDEGRAAAEAYRQYRLLASAPIIWPPVLAEQQQQQLAFLWSQIDPRDQEQYIREFYRFHPPYVPPQLPDNAIRGVEPFRLINHQGQIINIIEEIPDDILVGDTAVTGGRSKLDMESGEEAPGDETSSIPMMNRDGRVVYLIR